MRSLKLKAANLGKADAVADIELINQFSNAELQPEDVYCFSMIICDNDVDRDNERFTDKCLTELAPLFVGKTVIKDHWPSADKQFARIYRTEVVSIGDKTIFGEPMKGIRADTYIPRKEAFQKMIDAIEGGIAKEVSVGCKITENSCSICKKPLRFNWSSWHSKCENDHVQGQTYDGKLCVGELSKPTEAYEVSFCAVPSQRRAGVVKSATDTEVLAAVEVLKSADPARHSDQLLSLMPLMKIAATDEGERAQREAIAQKAKDYLKARNEK